MKLLDCCVTKRLCGCLPILWFTKNPKEYDEHDTDYLKPECLQVEIAEIEHDSSYSLDCDVEKDTTPFIFIKKKAVKPKDHIALSLLLVPECVDVTISDLLHLKAFPENQTYESASALNNRKISAELRNNLISKILRYRIDSDKLAQMCSILLKSRSYYQYSSNSGSIKTNMSPKNFTPKQKISIVDLPRTKHGKPYIVGDTDHNLSISHQHPAVGAAIYLNNENHLSQYKVGLDLVVMEEKSIRNMVHMEMSFTQWEWKMCSSMESKEERAKEILLRWAMKEAYTKALGLGLGMEFSSIEIRLDGIDENINNDTEIGVSRWNQVIKDDMNGFTTRGRVIQRHVKQSFIIKQEIWNFTFFNIAHLFSEFQSLKDTIVPSLSCACVSYGPISPSKQSQTSTLKIPVSVDLISFFDLLEWHNGEETST